MVDHSSVSALDFVNSVRVAYATTPMVQRIALLEYGTLYAKIGFGMAIVTLEFNNIRNNNICNKFFYLVGTKGCISILDEF